MRMRAFVCELIRKRVQRGPKTREETRVSPTHSPLSSLRTVESSSDMYQKTVQLSVTVSLTFMKKKWHYNERHPLFYLMTLISLHSPLTDSLLRLLLLMCSLMKPSKGLTTDFKIYRFSMITYTRATRTARTTGCGPRSPCYLSCICMYVCMYTHTCTHTQQGAAPDHLAIFRGHDFRFA
jgi:hypothetical protein